MTVTANAFRGRFPEFGENMVYTDPVIDLWLGIGAKLMNVQRWGNLLQTGIDLFAAHNLVIERQAMAAVAAGAAPGLATAPMNNKSVDKVSAGYDTAATLEMGAGHWNLTVYGMRFKRLANMMGAGPLQIGPAGGSNDPLSSVNAFAGPDTTPGFSNFS